MLALRPSSGERSGGVRRRLGAGAGGGGDGDVGQGRSFDRDAAADDLEVIQRVRAVAEEHRHGLAEVEHAAAADRDHDVDAGGPRRVGRGADVVQGRLVRDGHHGGGVHVPQEVRRAGRVPAGAQQHPPSERRQQAGEFGGAAGTEQHPPGECEVEPGHQPASSGNTDVNLARVRGSAIISATASCQRA